MRIRTIKPDFFADEDLAALDAADRLAFIGLWCVADKAGRLEDRPQRIAALVFPYDQKGFDARLDRLTRARFLVRYQADGRRLIAIRTWEKHQKPHHTEQDSELPAPPTPPQEERKGKEGSAFSDIAPSNHGESTLNAPCIDGGPENGRSRPKKGSPALEGFEDWYGPYPRKSARAQAEKAWAKLTPDQKRDALAAVLIFANAWSGADEERRQFIPYPATWLGNQRWKDDPATWVREARNGNGTRPRPIPGDVGTVGRNEWKPSTPEEAAALEAARRAEGRA